MDSKMIAGIVIGALVVGGGAFYGGMQYESSSQTSQRGQGFANRIGAGGRFGTGGANGGFTAGTIISKDANSITIQLGGPGTGTTNGSASGSKIVLVNGSTQVGKFTTGTADDLAVGDSVTVQGSQNSDGSVTAQMIQIRPAGMGTRDGRTGTTQTQTSGQ